MMIRIINSNNDFDVEKKTKFQNKCKVIKRHVSCLVPSVEYHHQELIETIIIQKDNSIHCMITSVWDQNGHCKH